ncbi:MAG: OmpA family protein [Bacteroidales bacterium]|nr:OmpA family protein [Bacteroidales bacterium]
MKKTTLFVLFCAITFASYSQSRTSSTRSGRAERLYNQGLDDYDQNKISTAISFFKDALKEDPNFSEVWLMLGEIYEQHNMTDSAIFAYRKFANLNPAIHPRAVHNLAVLEYSQGLYEEAEKSFLQYLTLPIRSEDVKARANASLEKVRIAMDFRNNPKPFDPTNLGDSINTDMDEYFPVTTVDQKTLIITRRTRTEVTPTPATNRLNVFGRPATDVENDQKVVFREDFYISTFDETEQTWSKAVRMPEPITSDFNEGAQSISPDGRELYFTGCNRPDGKGGCDIYVSKRVGDTWSRPFNLGSPVNTGAWESQPSIAPDGRTLYFASNRQGGKGGSDIWLTVLQDDGMWSEPENLGDSVNSTGNESSPYIHYDNQTLYFVSDGHPGLGGKDIFYTRKKSDGTWGTPVNLGYPINTHKDEISFFVNSKGDIAFLSSDRPGGKGKQDIYSFELYREARPLAVSYLQGKLFDASSQLPLDAKFEIINLRTGQIVASAESDEVSGDFLVPLPTDGDYALNISREGYLFHSEHFELGDIADQIKPKTIDVPLAEIKTGESIVLRNIFFETNDFGLKPESTQELERLVRMMRENPNIQIEISGHTDNVGSENLNQRLSENRAKAVYDFLIGRGVNSNRLRYKGYGMSKPIAPNDTEDGRAQNRRTEIQIL